MSAHSGRRLREPAHHAATQPDVLLQNALEQRWRQSEAAHAAVNARAATRGQPVAQAGGVQRLREIEQARTVAADAIAAEARTQGTSSSRPAGVHCA